MPQISKATEYNWKRLDCDLQEGLQKSLQKIIELIRENPNITTSEMANRVGISRQSVAKITKTLQTKGIIQRVGPDKGGHWEIVKK